MTRIHSLALLALSVAFTLPAMGADAPPSRHELDTLATPVIAERVLGGIEEPVAIEFLPNGKALVAQRKAGVITLADFATGEATNLTGLGDMHVKDSSGVHDIELHPDFEQNQWVYITYSAGDEHRSNVVLDRFRLNGSQAEQQERLFSADAFSEGLYHYAARIAFKDGYIYMGIGDREHPPMAQDVGNHAGTLVRLHDDGRVPADNPFVDSGPIDGTQPRPEIWNYGHRDPQGLYVHPETGEIWLHDHGPKGGDEVNLMKKGANYGWPVISYGFEYDGGPIGMGIPTQEGMETPYWVYVPSIAPSDLVIYDGDAFPQWKGNFLLGAMAGLHLNRLVMKNSMVVAEERIGRFMMGRIRAVAIDQAGLVYLGSDNGEIWRLSPGE